jgi:hypothetical protein
VNSKFPADQLDVGHFFDCVAGTFAAWSAFFHAARGHVLREFWDPIRSIGAIGLPKAEPHVPGRSEVASTAVRKWRAGHFSGGPDHFVLSIKSASIDRKSPHPDGSGDLKNVETHTVGTGYFALEI